MTTVATSSPVANPQVHYARLYGGLEGYLVQLSTGLVFVDHDGNFFPIPEDHAAACELLGAVPAVERSNVLQALAQGALG